MIHADEQGSMVGYEDVHTRIDICRGHYEKVGLGARHIDQFIG
jgi:2,4'-dihydroxyacetophenone dioxygenase